MNCPRYLCVLSFVAFLGACGGGGGGGAPANTNTPPVANAVAAQTVTVNAAVALDGSGSSDANGDTLSYAWTLTGKPAGSTAIVGSASFAKATFVADVAGVYTAMLVVNDGKQNGSSTTSVSITAAAVNVVGPGQFVDAVHLKTISPAEVGAALALDGEAAFLATPKYAVQAWRLTYLTVDGQGQQILASGLVAVPDKATNALSPVLSYQHATIKRQADAPSSLTKLGDPPVVLASLGYIAQAADYVGYGVSAAAPHPYLLSGPSASAVIDFLTAAKYWRQTRQVPDNKQLFLTGYSEGGYVTMATHKALQAGTSAHRNELVRVVAGAGPYNVGATMDQLLAIIRETYPPLGQLLNPGILKFLSDDDRRHARDLLMGLSLGIDAEVTFMPTVIDNYLADNRTAIETFSDVFDWAPQIPVSLFHGRDDRTVPYLSATSTLQAMQARGAGDRVSLTECVAPAGEPAGHKECVLPYWRFVLDQFSKAAKDL
ncbi:S9 family peptidase [Ramlibacter sp. WS9]|uniref:alpha/beta hydrolase family protein n=1 Tax=Ramlibacter sp. WS9 TaxID=1882741 RepID=UPI00130522B8|nr:PKD domain-containing protein [Ramlibacter sp. WS9]